MVRSGQFSRNQTTGESQGTEELTSNGIGNQSLGKFAKSHPRDSDQDPPTERKGKSERIPPNTIPLPTPPPLAESAHFLAEAHSNRLRMEYIPTPQYENEEHACPFWGRHAARTAHPEGRAKFTPFPCGTCDWCRAYKKFGRAEQYWASNPSPTATVLTVEFPDIESADRFAKLPGHRSRIPGIRKHIGFQQADGWALDEPCLVRILWDTVPTDKQQKAILRHANKSSPTAMNLDIRPVSKSQFRDWLPDLFTIVSDNGKRINTSRFSSGWAQEMKLPDDWRNGLTRRVTEKDEQKWTSRPFQGKRAKAIRESWIHHYKMSRNPLLPPEERQKLEQAAQARLERARYLNTMDWLHRWKILQPLHIEATREFVEAYLRGENPDVREWQKTTSGPKALPVELARWLNGERESEPAILLAADRLGYNTPLGPHVDAHFLRELTAPLGSLELHATEESGSAPWKVPEPMAA